MDKQAELLVQLATEAVRAGVITINNNGFNIKDDTSNACIAFETAFDMYVIAHSNSRREAFKVLNESGLTG
jgi:hypothetical protein